MNPKRALRAIARAWNPVTPAESAAVIRTLRGWLADQPSSAVLVYLGMPGEIAAEGVCAEGTHRWLTTRTPPSGPLTIHPFDAPREQHPFGFSQPTAAAPVVDPAQVGIVLVPGLCFDAAGRRLGRGRGYYDTLLAAMPAAVPVGVTLERMMVPLVPTEPHDVAMRWLATEGGVRAAE